MDEEHFLECGVCGVQHGAGEDHAYEYANAGGIDGDLVDAITAQPIVDGVQLPCEHMFSRRSLLQWLAKNHSCPTCRVRVRVRDVKPVVRFAKNKLDEILVRNFCYCFHESVDPKTRSFPPFMLEQVFTE